MKFDFLVSNIKATSLVIGFLISTPKSNVKICFFFQFKESHLFPNGEFFLYLPFLSQAHVNAYTSRVLLLLVSVEDPN